MNEAQDPQWHAWDDIDLRLLHDQALRAGKTARAEAIAAELVRREAGRQGVAPGEEFHADEIACLQELAAVLERWGMTIETDGRMRVRVDKHPAMTFQTLSSASILAQLGVGAPPSRVPSA